MRVLTRINRLAVGNAGDVKSVGEGVFERRITYGSGYIDAEMVGYCAPHLLFRIIDGFYFIYHIERDSEHATLGIVKSNNRWYLNQIMGLGDAPVSEGLKAKAEEWIRFQYYKR